MAKIMIRAPTPIKVAVQFQSPTCDDRRPQLLEGVTIAEADAKELAELADDDLDRHTGDEPGHDSLPHEIGYPPQFNHAGNKEDKASGDGQGSGHYDRCICISTGERPHRTGRDGGH